MGLLRSLRRSMNRIGRTRKRQLGGKRRSRQVGGSGCGGVGGHDFGHNAGIVGGARRRRRRRTRKH